MPRGLPRVLVSVWGPLLLSGDGPTQHLSLPGCVSPTGSRPGQHSQSRRESVPGWHDQTQTSPEGGNTGTIMMEKIPLSFLGYLDCREVSWRILFLLFQLVWWKPLGLWQLAHRLDSCLVSPCLMRMNCVNSKFYSITRYYLLSDCLVLGEPDKDLKTKCVIIGRSGKWRDGVCNFYPYSMADCLCKQ